MKKSGAIVGLTTLSLLTGAAFAQTSPATTAATTSSVSAQEVAPSLWSKISLNYSGLYHGFAINNPNSYQPSTSGGVDALDNGGPQVIENTIGLGYRITPEVSVNGAFNWDWRPVMGQDFKLQNPYVNVKHSKLISVGGFNLAADLRAYIPATNASRDIGFRTGFRFNQNATYEIPGTKLSLGAYVYERVNLYGEAGNGNPAAYDGRLYLGPSVNYQVLPTLGVSLLFEADFRHAKGAPGSLLSLDTSPEDALDIEPTISWDITPSVNFSPYLNFYPRNLTLNSSAVGALLTVKFL